MKATLFISDLHLQPDEPGITALFHTFLQDPALEAEAIYILGDLFETWIGDDDLNLYNCDIMQALKKVTQAGVKIFFMHGNRDFLIGKKFSEATGVQLLPEPFIINLYGQPTLLLHGDSLCTQDPLHQRWRKMTRHRIFQHLSTYLPLSWRRKIGQWLRNQSRRHLKQLSDERMDVNEQEVIRQMQIHQVNRIIHGHTHRQAIHHLSCNHQPAQRIVLSAWHETGSALLCNKTQCEFINISDHPKETIQTLEKAYSLLTELPEDFFRTQKEFLTPQERNF